MGLLKKRILTGNPGNDRLAEHIASVIISRQRAIAFKVNAFINRYSRRSQKRFLVLFCLCWLAAICYSIYQLRCGTGISNAQKNYQPVHIGKAFERPQPTTKIIKPTDSLTIKK